MKKATCMFHKFYRYGNFIIPYSFKIVYMYENVSTALFNIFIKEIKGVKSFKEVYIYMTVLFTMGILLY